MTDGSRRWTEFTADYAFIGRTFEEYCRLFDLDPERLSSRRILDCPAGPASFVAAARDRGISAVGADVMYDRSASELADRTADDVRQITSQHRLKEDQFVWEFYDDPDERLEYLERASGRFLDDYAEGKEAGRYVRAKLPDLPFDRDAFSLVLSGHFLFLYEDRLDYDFHLETLRELARVASEEVRVFPLVGMDSRPYRELEALRTDLETEGIDTEIRDVDFEFQPGATEMLVLTPP